MTGYAYTCLQILEHLWPHEWGLTSGNVYQPVRLCLSLQEAQESLVTTLAWWSWEGARR